MDIGLIVSAVVAVLVLLITYLLYNSMVRPRHFPPGPLGVPVLGSLHLLGEYPERKMLELSKEYGKIFSLKFVNQNFVCVCGFEANRDVLMKMKLCDRRVIYAFKMAKGADPTGLVHNDHWPPLAAYRDLVHDVFAKKIEVVNNSQRAANDTISAVMKTFEKLANAGEAVPLSSTLDLTGIDVLLRLLFGTGVPDSPDEDYTKVTELLKNMRVIPEVYLEWTFNIPEIIRGLPRFLLPESSKKFLTSSREILDYAKSEVEKHKRTFDPENLRDLVDCYLLKMKKEEDSNSSDPIFTEHALLAIIYDFFLSGTENIPCVTGFSTLYLAKHQAIQKRLRTKVAKVLKSGDVVKSSDMDRIPYAKATVHEVFRYSNIAPNGVPRKASKHLTFHGYSIPKGTVFMLNTYSSHFQEDKWKNANNFDPENFLNEDGSFQANEAYMPFGGGLRKCVASSFMEEFAFMFLVNLVQKFDVEQESPDTEIDYEPLPGLVASPKPQKIRLIPRK